MSKERSCAACNNSFNAEHHFQKYCSVTCRPVGHKHKISSWDRSPRFCIVCAKTFLPVSFNNKYCSKECLNVASRYEGKNNVRYASCVVCRKYFVTKSANKKYCSKECSNVVLGYKHKVIQSEQRRCVVCNNTYSTKIYNKKYCSNSCAASRTRPAITLKPYVQKTTAIELRCKACETLFVRPKGNVRKVYCSDDCRLKAYARSALRPKAKPTLSTLEFDCYFKDEREFHQWFDKSYFLFGIKRLVASDRLFPDIIAQMVDGRVLNIEIEYHASNFSKHQHNHWNCDLVIAFAKGYKQSSVCSVPVLALFNVSGHQVGTTSLDWRSRELTPEFTTLCHQQNNLVTSLLERPKSE